MTHLPVTDGLSGPSQNDGKMMTRRIPANNRSTVILSYSHSDAMTLRGLTQTLILKGDKRPSMSVLARRSLAVYLARLETARGSRPEVFASEIAELQKLVTPVARPAKTSKRKEP